MVRLVLMLTLSVSAVGLLALAAALLGGLLWGAPMVGTPAVVLEEMLELAELRPGDKVYDLGCGDGRLVIAAVLGWGVEAVGIEIAPWAYALACLAATWAHARVRLVRGDLLRQDFADADVVFCYLMPALMARLQEPLGRLRAGSRVVSHRFPIPGWVPEKILLRTSRRPFPPVYLYRATGAPPSPPPRS